MRAEREGAINQTPLPHNINFVPFFFLIVFAVVRGWRLPARVSKAVDRKSDGDKRQRLQARQNDHPRQRWEQPLVSLRRLHPGKGGAISAGNFSIFHPMS